MMPTSEGGYKQFKIGDLFDIHPTKAYKFTNKSLFASGGMNPVVANSSTNNGIGGYSNLPTTEDGNMITFSDTTTSDAIFYQPHPFIGYPHVQGLYPKKYLDKWNEKTLLYIMSLFRKCAQGRFDYATKFTRIIALEMPLLLPVDKSGEIDFNFIESRVRELEEERVRELEAYLAASNFSDCSLTLAEKNALNSFKDGHIRYVKKSIKSILKGQTGDVDLQQKDIDGEGCYFINSGVQNMGIKGKTSREAKIFAANTITIDFFGNAYYRPFEYKMATHNHVFSMSGDIIKNENIGLYLTVAMSYFRHLFSFSDMGTLTTINDLEISLPLAKDGSPDYAFMENFINAIKKQTIAHVKEFIEREHNAYLQVIENKEEQSEPEAQAHVIPLYPEYREGCLPLYSIRAACGYFDEGQLPEAEGWIETEGRGLTPDPKRYFAVHAKGDSMLPKIKDGDICIFEWYHAGTRNGEIVLTQSSEYDDTYGGRYTIKRYHSEKIGTDEGWQHSKVELQPLNPDFEPIALSEDDDVRTIGIFKCVL